MGFNAKIVSADGRIQVVKYDGKLLSAILKHARIHVDEGNAIRVDVFDDDNELIAYYPASQNAKSLDHARNE